MMMPFFILALGVAIVLTIWFAFATDASIFGKVLLVALCIVSLLVRNSRFWVAGLILQVAISIFVLLYLKVKSL